MYVPLCMSACSCIYVSTYVRFLSFCLTYMSAYLYACPFGYLYVCLACLLVCLSVRLPVCLSSCLSVLPSVCPTICFKCSTSISSGCEHESASRSTSITMEMVDGKNSARG